MSRYNPTFWAISLISIILMSGVIYFLIKPIVTDTLAEYKDLQSSQTQLEELAKERDSLVAMQKDRENLDNLYNKVYGYLPTNNETGDFVAQAEAIGKTTNQNQTEISIKIVKSAAKTTDDTATTTSAKTAATSTTASAATATSTMPTFNINEISNLQDLIAFMQNMEKMMRKNTVENIVTILQADNSYQTVINGTIYYKAAPSSQNKITNLNITQAEKDKINALVHFGDLIK